MLTKWLLARQLMPPVQPLAVTADVKIMRLRLTFAR
jgi:hypothetical protein